MPTREFSHKAGNVRGGILVAVSITFFLFLVPTVFSEIEYIKGGIIYIIPGKNWYLIPKILTAQNLEKSGFYNITVTVWQNEVDYPFGSGYETLYSGATINGTVITPSGSSEGITFDNHGNGNYTCNYTFSNIGTYRIDVLGQSSTHGYSKSRAYIYVGKFPITTKIISGTEYQSGEEGQVIAYVEDADGNPITGATGVVTIRYPNTTVWLNAVSMAEIGNGLYYYNFTTPAITGMYTAFVNITSGVNSDTEGKAFHIAPWANLITKMEDYIVPRIITTVSWYPSNNAKFRIEFRNFTSQAVNVSTCTMRVYDPDDNIATLLNCTYDSVGNFYTNWTIGADPDLGMYYLRLAYTYGGISRTHYDAFRLSSGGPFDFSIYTEYRNYTSCEDFDVDFIMKNMGDVSLDVVIEYWLQSTTGANVSGTYTSETVLANYYSTTVANRSMNAQSVAPGTYNIKANLRYATLQPEVSASREMTFTTCRPEGQAGSGAGYFGDGDTIPGTKWIAWDLDVWNQGQVELDIGITKIELYQGSNDVPTFTEIYSTEDTILMKAYKYPTGSKYACDFSYGFEGSYVLSACSANAPVPLFAGDGACITGTGCHHRFSTKMPTAEDPCTDTECIRATDFVQYCSPHWCKIRIYAMGEDTVTTMGSLRTHGDLSYAEFAMTAYPEDDPETAKVTVVY